MKALLPWIVSALALLGMVMVGRILWQGWVVLLTSEVLFIAVAVSERLWGLIPLSVALLVTYAKNTLAWRSSTALAGEHAGWIRRERP